MKHKRTKPDTCDQHWMYSDARQSPSDNMDDGHLSCAVNTYIYLPQYMQQHGYAWDNLDV